MSKTKPTTLGDCRLCGEFRKCRDVNFVYQYSGKDEVYSNLLHDCFGIQLMSLQQCEGLVCAPCVIQLRTSCNFKQRVLACEEQLMKKFQDESSTSAFVKDEDPVYIETEFLDGSVYCDDDDDDDDDDDNNDDDDENKTLDKLKSESNIDIEIRSIQGDKRSPSPPEEKQSLLRELLQKDVPVKPVARPEAKPAPAPVVPRQKLKPLSAKEKLDKERQLRIKKLLLLKMEKLKAQQKKKLATKALPNGKSRRKGKDYYAFQNTVQIVENSYVCPFKNIIGTYYCYYCRSVFLDPIDLREHSATHEPGPFTRLWRKNKAVKLDITRIDCRLCDAKINDIPTLKQHLTKAHNKTFHPIDNEFLKFKLTHPKIECLECGQSFLFIDRLIKHMTEHFGKCVCDKCGATFIQPSSLEAHLRCHDKLNTKFPCNICEKNFTTNRSRHMHVSVVHEKNPVIDCFHCDQKFLSYAHRNKHMVEAHNHNNSIPCLICGKVFASRNRFTVHNQMVHLKEYKYHCEVCAKKFITIKQLNQHSKIHKKD